MMYDSFRHGDRLIQCPYDNTHMILAKSFNGHLIKCRNNHPGHKMVACQFDKTHLIAKPELAHHYTECPSRYLLDREKQMYAEKASNKQGLCGDVEGPKIKNSQFYDLSEDERWDIEEYQGGPRGLFNKKPMKHEQFESATEGPDIPRTYYESTATSNSYPVPAQKTEEVSSRLPHGSSKDARMAGSQRATPKAAINSQVYEYSLMGRSGAGRGMRGRGYQKAEPKVGVVSPLQNSASPSPSQASPVVNGTSSRGRGVAKYATNGARVGGTGGTVQTAAARGSRSGSSAIGVPQRSLPDSLLGSQEGAHRQQHIGFMQQEQQQPYEMTQEPQLQMDIQQVTSQREGVTGGSWATPSGRGLGHGSLSAWTVLGVGRDHQAGLIFAGDLQQQPVMRLCGPQFTQGQGHGVINQTLAWGEGAASDASLRWPFISPVVQGLHASTGTIACCQQEQEGQDEDQQSLSENELPLPSTSASVLSRGDVLQSQIDSTESERDDASSVISSLSSRLASSTVSDIDAEDVSEYTQVTSTVSSSKLPQDGKEMLENLLKAKRRMEKKLKQIERLEAKAAQGHILSAEETIKISRKATLAEDLARLQLALPSAEP